MYRIIITIVAVLLFVSPSQAVKVDQGGKVLNEHAVQIGGKRSPLGPNVPVQSSAGTFYGVSFAPAYTPACASPYSGFPIDFEGSGTCAAQEAQITFATSGTDCDYTTTVLEGSESAYLNGQELRMLLGGVATDYKSAKTRMAWRYRYVTEPNNNRLFVQPMNGATVTPVSCTSSHCMKLYSLVSSPNIQYRFYDTEGAPPYFSSTSTGSSLVTGTTYLMCYEYDPSVDTSWFFVDEVDGEWCAGAYASLNWAGNGANVAVTDFNAFGITADFGANLYEAIVDEITACDAP